MSDIGSDSDATLADSIDEEDVNSPASSPNSHTAEIGYPECVLSLQRGQRVLFEKLEHITAETTTVQYGNLYDVCVAECMELCMF